LSWRASALSSLTSSEVASRAVSPASRFLHRLQELLRPTVVQVLIDPFLAAQLSNAVLATQDLPVRCRSSLQRKRCRRVALRISRTVFSALSGMRLLACLIVAPQRDYDEPAILSYAISSLCPTSADGLQARTREARRGWPPAVGAPRASARARDHYRHRGPLARLAQNEAEAANLIQIKPGLNENS